MSGVGGANNGNAISSAFVTVATPCAANAASVRVSASIVMITKVLMIAEAMAYRPAEWSTQET